MGAPDLLHHLQEAGLALSLTADGGIKVTPASELSDTDRQAIRQHKAELLALLAGHTELAPNGMNEAECERFVRRMDRLTRWGWPQAEAQELAERLTRRDRTDDDRVTCTDCHHYRPGRCGNHARAGLQTTEAGRDLASLPQRCPGFQGEDK